MATDSDAQTLSEDDRDIIDLIERETTAFLMRDFDAWADCWIHEEFIRRLASLPAGLMEFHEGWEIGRDTVSDFFSKFPTPNPQAAGAVRRTGYSIRNAGIMAWVSYDQYCETSDDPLVTVGLSHQIRILEKTEGQWRIAMAGHGDTGLEYFDFPAIRVDKSLRIQWMNDAARSELPSHPALIKSGAFLRGQRRGDDAKLRQAVTELAGMNIMEIRPSMQNPRGRISNPIILQGDDADGQHIVWVSGTPDTLLVTFRDSANETARLEDAAELFQLSPAQMRVAALLVQGMGLTQVALSLGISLNTAKTHLSRIFDKTGTRSQTALVAVMLGIARPS